MQNDQNGISGRLVAPLLVLIGIIAISLVCFAAFVFYSSPQNPNVNLIQFLVAGAILLISIGAALVHKGAVTTIGDAIEGIIRAINYRKGNITTYDEQAYIEAKEAEGKVEKHRECKEDIKQEKI
jgi:hypothetical protein